jgi:hypothetical protein
MPTTSLAELTIVAQAVLDTTVTILNTTPALAPDSQFLTPSRPAFDCEFVAVQVARLGEETTSPLTTAMVVGNRDRFGNVILATYVIYVVRCAPEMQGSNPPTDAAKTASATTIQEDGWAIWNGWRDQQDFVFDDCIGVHFDGGVPIQEEGGFIGWQFQLRAMIEGYNP